MITVIGSLNLDVFLEVERLPRPGETIAATSVRRSPGGKGANQAVAAARLGASVAMIGAVGADAAGDELVASLAAAGVDTSGVARRPAVASGTALIVVERGGQNQIVIARGANDTLSADDVRRRAELIRRSKAVVTQLESPLEAVETALELARASGALAVLNPAPFRPLDRRLLQRCDWIIPNELEAERLSGLEVHDPKSAATAADILREQSGGGNIAVTLGAAGAWIQSRPFTGLVPAPQVNAVDAVGAGDTFVGGLVSQLVEGAAVQAAARFACMAAALAVTRRGAQEGIPTRAEVEAFAK